MTDPGTALPAAPVAVDRAELTVRLRQRLAEGRAQLRERYLAGLPARRMLRGQAAVADGLLRDAWRHVKMPASAALLAVVAYGPGLLAPAPTPAPGEAAVAALLVRRAGGLGCGPG